MRKNSFKNLSCGRNLAPKKTWKFLRWKEKEQEKFHKVDYSNIFILIFAYFITHFCVHLINIRFFNGGEMGFGCLLKLCEELTGNSSHSCKFWWVISLYTVIKTTMLQRTLPTVSQTFSSYSNHEIDDLKLRNMLWYRDHFNLFVWKELCGVKRIHVMIFVFSFSYFIFCNFSVFWSGYSIGNTWANFLEKIFETNVGM